MNNNNIIIINNNTDKKRVKINLVNDTIYNKIQQKKKNMILRRNQTHKIIEVKNEKIETSSKIDYNFIKENVIEKRKNIPRINYNNINEIIKDISNKKLISNNKNNNYIKIKLWK